jgi:ComF family protein
VSAAFMGPYRGELRKAVHLLKFSGRRALAFGLGKSVASREACTVVSASEIVVPVPLSRQRLAERGYNQAALIAVGLARGADLPLVPRGLSRARHTQPQAGLSAASRRANLRGAFRATGGLVTRRRVLLIDDVYTTGATVQAAASALLAGGAREVRVFALARSMPTGATNSALD